ncbi:sel1 repeat family protein [Helicobacter acinonychis]|uniref:sel1 repeat family protein n=1 Tax=Helicobacter acinonychis TaxID=212 RepID=UPI001F2F7DF7|nr:sel1 repeat family protein [Helicobacter acinonychis]
MGLGNVNGGASYFIHAKKFIKKACELNSGRGCYFLASYFYDSDGMYGTAKKDLEKATQYYVKACELNDLFGCLALSSRLQTNKNSFNISLKLVN